MDIEIEKNLEIAKLTEAEKLARERYEKIHEQMVLDREEQKLLNEIVYDANKHLDDLQAENEEL